MTLTSTSREGYARGSAIPSRASSHNSTPMAAPTSNLARAPGMTTSDRPLCWSARNLTMTAPWQRWSSHGADMATRSPFPAAIADGNPVGPAGRARGPARLAADPIRHGSSREGIRRDSGTASGWRRFALADVKSAQPLLAAFAALAPPNGPTTVPGAVPRQREVTGSTRLGLCELGVTELRPRQRSAPVLRHQRFRHPRGRGVGLQRVVVAHARDVARPPARAAMTRATCCWKAASSTVTSGLQR